MHRRTVTGGPHDRDRPAGPERPHHRHVRRQPRHRPRDPARRRPPRRERRHPGQDRPARSAPARHRAHRGRRDRAGRGQGRRRRRGRAGRGGRGTRRRHRRRDLRRRRHRRQQRQRPEHQRHRRRHAQALRPHAVDKLARHLPADPDRAGPPQGLRRRAGPHPVPADQPRPEVARRVPALHALQVRHVAADPGLGARVRRRRHPGQLPVAAHHHRDRGRDEPAGRRPGRRACPHPRDHGRRGPGDPDRSGAPHRAHLHRRRGARRARRHRPHPYGDSEHNDIDFFLEGTDPADLPV